MNWWTSATGIPGFCSIWYSTWRATSRPRERRVMINSPLVRARGDGDSRRGNPISLAPADPCPCEAGQKVSMPRSGRPVLRLLK